MGEGSVGRGFGGDFGAGIGPGGNLPASNGLGDQLQGDGAGKWEATGHIPTTAGQLWLWDQATGKWKLSTGPTATEQMLFWDATGVLYKPTGTPTAAGQVQVWNGAGYTPADPLRYEFGASTTGNVAALRYLFPGYMANAATTVVATQAERLVDRSGRITNYTFRFRVAPAAQNTDVTLWINEAQQSVFTINAGVQAAQGAWAGGPFVLARGDRVAIGVQAALADATASYPDCVAS